MRDLKRDDTGDLLIENDDLVVFVSDTQHKEDLIMTDKGELKQYPEAGVGAVKYLESEDPAGLLREISTQYSADGMKVEKVAFRTDGKIDVVANYEA